MFGGGAGDILGGGTVPDDATPDDYIDTADLSALAAAANSAYEKALAAQKNGDWAAYGQHLEELQHYLQLMTK